VLSGGILKQIILVTDGHSNKGGSPIDAAYRAGEQGITVNAIGILDAGRLGRLGREEVLQIAGAGGGICHFTSTENLGSTVHSITVQATRYSIELFVNQHLQKIEGTDLHNISPARRGKIIPILTKLEDELELHLALVIDASGSMANKSSQVKQSLQDFLLSLKARRGLVKFAVVQFPGPIRDTAILKQLHSENHPAGGLFQSIRYGGLTPTGPAIDTAVNLLNGSGYSGYIESNGLRGEII